ncbi:hypothetical protein [Enterococcus pallens]|uniref:Uncharacterized protein n=1 Tax=Enterococcus pallens ATCC BAA-351 TaxID=1158607 RepID=R2QBB5_9ENTE|nr:hypothetical protein [Enterococcus pallens]EOH93732.1 hypothetical protein UAU_02428 [Enterococcus pallens ATCC BAA-351]EOU24572.1 hypothetical protein I588_00559 [Enterococcus pallens ATCC BAA-351]OJG78542.1 hypothetical protein RV10_GL001324 [Enterococcus pallens]
MTEKERKSYLFWTSMAFFVGGFIRLCIVTSTRMAFERNHRVVSNLSLFESLFGPIREGVLGGYLGVLVVSGILCYYYFMKGKPLWFQLLILILFFVRPAASVIIYFWGSWYWTYVVFQYNLMKFWQTTKRGREYNDLY